MRSIVFTKSLGTVAALSLATSAFAGVPVLIQGITGVTSTDNSSVNPNNTWVHQTSASSVTNAGNAYQFTHTTQLLNAATFNGGVAQTNVGNSSFQLAFTVEDPLNLGFTLDIDQLLQGYSAVDTTAGRGDATGVSYYVQVDDSTDAPGTLSVNTNLFISTPGVIVDLGADPTVTSKREFFSETESASLGSYTGTTDFVLDYTTFFSPTTNVFFQNQSVGSGSINYGLGSLPANDPYDAEDLGHFLTVTATYVPEPAALSGLSLAAVTLGRRRRSA